MNQITSTPEQLIKAIELHLEEKKYKNITITKTSHCESNNIVSVINLEICFHICRKMSIEIEIHLDGTYHPIIKSINSCPIDDLIPILKELKTVIKNCITVQPLG